MPDEQEREEKDEVKKEDTKDIAPESEVPSPMTTEAASAEIDGTEVTAEIVVPTLAQEPRKDGAPEVVVGVPLESVAKADEPALVRAAYEHPLPIRITHWVNAIALFVMITSGLRIFRAFPSFGPKIPEKVLLDIPKSLTIGGWLGGALQWHFTFMWLFAGSGVIYVLYQVFSGHFRTMLFTPRDIPGVWPMARHYFLFGPKPPATGQYNPLQKLAYTSTIGFGALSLLTGIVLYKPAQFAWLAFLFGGFHLTRIWHFGAMCGFLSFIPGHLIMVALHGWSNFVSMLSGWKREPEYQE